MESPSLFIASDSPQILCDARKLQICCPGVPSHCFPKLYPLLPVFYVIIFLGLLPLFFAEVCAT